MDVLCYYIKDDEEDSPDFPVLLGRINERLSRMPPHLRHPTAQHFLRNYHGKPDWLHAKFPQKNAPRKVRRKEREDREREEREQREQRRSTDRPTQASADGNVAGPSNTNNGTDQGASVPPNDSMQVDAPSNSDGAPPLQWTEWRAWVQYLSRANVSHGIPGLAYNLRAGVSTVSDNSVQGMLLVSEILPAEFRRTHLTELFQALRGFYQRRVETPEDEPGRNREVRLQWDSVTLPEDQVNWTNAVVEYMLGLPWTYFEIHRIHEWTEELENFIDMEKEGNRGPSPAPEENTDPRDPSRLDM